MNFYKIKDGLPNDKIVKENMIFSINVKEGEFTLDLEKYNIVVEEDFLKNKKQEFRYLVYKNYKVIYGINEHKNQIEINDG